MLIIIKRGNNVIMPVLLSDISCPGELEYRGCVDSCAHSCASLAVDMDCDNMCVEGCACPHSMAMDYNGRCIPVADCPCKFDERMHASGTFMEMGNETW